MPIQPPSVVLPVMPAVPPIVALPVIAAVPIVAVPVTAAAAIVPVPVIVALPATVSSPAASDTIESPSVPPLPVHLTSAPGVPAPASVASHPLEVPVPLVFVQIAPVVVWMNVSQTLPTRDAVRRRAAARDDARPDVQRDAIGAHGLRGHRRRQELEQQQRGQQSIQGTRLRSRPNSPPMATVAIDTDARRRSA